MPTAIITGASRGLGLALARALVARRLAAGLDARGAADLEAVARELGQLGDVTALPGDVADPEHRRALVEAAGGRIDLLVNNASMLGPSPQPALADYPLAELERVYRVNVLAPLALIQLALPHIPDGGTIINVTSDAAVEAYEGWGGYGSSKAALEQLSAILGAEHPELRVYAVDPGDMRTQMHQEAFPGEDISRPPAARGERARLLALIDGDLPSGRYRAHDLAHVQTRVSAPRARVRAAARRSRPHEPPEARGLARDEVRLMVAQPRRRLASPTRASATSPEFLSRATCSWSTPRRPCPRPCPRGASDGTLPRAALRHRGATPPRTAAGGSSSCAAATAHAVPRRRGGRAPDARRRRRRSSWRRPTPAGARLWLARFDRATSRCTSYLARHGQPIRYGYVPQRVAARGLPDRLRARPGQRRDAERGAAVHRRARHAARGARGPVRAAHAAHRRLLARAPRAALPGALRGAGDDRAARERGARAGADA